MVIMAPKDINSPRAKFANRRQEMLTNLVIDSSSLFVKLNYAVLFFTVMIVIYFFAVEQQEKVFYKVHSLILNIFLKSKQILYLR